MDNDTKRFFGKILGELYRLQRHNGARIPVGDECIYGLLNGFESVIDEELERIGWVPTELQRNAEKVLDAHWNNPANLSAFKGFYTIEHALQGVGVDRSTAIRILTYHQANGSFAELIEKMNSQHSPVECKTFELDPWEK